MVREIFKETASKQGSSIDHGEEGNSHMSDSTTDLNSNIANVNVKLENGKMPLKRTNLNQS